MKQINFREKLRMALGGVCGVLRKPSYFILLLILALLFAILIFLIINWNFYGSLLLSSLGLIDKLNLLLIILGKIFSNALSDLNGFLLLVVSLLQGISLSLMIFTMRHNKRWSAKAASGGTLATIAAALGLGCVPCGTSIVLPVVSIFFSSSAYAAANIASSLVLLLAFLLSFYSIYKLGGVAFAFVASSPRMTIKKGNKS